MSGRLRQVGRRKFQSLRVRNFRLFFVGQLVSNTGNWLTTVGLTLLILHRTNRGLAVGLLAACQFGPILLLSAWAGLIADRSNKRRLLIVTQAMEMAESCALAALAFMHHAPLLAFYGVALAGGTMLAFDNPVRRSFVSEMVPKDDATNAVTLYMAMVNTSRIVGPALAGLLVVTVGFGWCFTIDAISYLSVLTALWMMRPSELRPALVTPRGKGQVRAGIRYVRGIPDLWVPFVMLMITGTLAYNFNTIFPLFIEKGLGGDDGTYTLIYSVFSVGSLLGALAIADRTTIRLRTIIVGAAAFGVSLLVLSVVPNIEVAFPAVMVVGFTTITYMTSVTAVVQIRADPQMRGRVLALQTILVVGTTPIGGPILGAVADAFGTRTSVFIGGVAALAAAAFGLVTERRLLRRDAHEQQQAVLPRGA